MKLTRLTSDWIAVRELKQEHTGSVIQLEDLNKKLNTVITGIVEQVGPGKRYKGGLVVPVELRVGQTVYYEIERGRARLPWDLDVRIMRESDVSGVLEPQETVRDSVKAWVDESLEEMGYPPVSEESVTVAVDPGGQDYSAVWPIERVNKEEMMKLYPDTSEDFEKQYLGSFPAEPEPSRCCDVVSKPLMSNVEITRAALKILDKAHEPFRREPVVQPHPDDLSDTERERICAQNRLLSIAPPPEEPC